MAAPKRNQPSRRTFLIRRIIALVLVVLVVWAVWAAIAGVVGFVGGIFGSKAKPAASASSSVAGTANTNAAGANATTCLAKGVSVLAVVGDGQKPVASFGKYSNPRLWFSITNNSQKPCYFNVGTKVQNFTITSGSETIWTNTQCLSPTSNARLLLQPATALTSPAIIWERVRSSATGCDAATKQLATAAGYYHLNVTVNGVKSNDVQFELQ